MLAGLEAAFVDIGLEKNGFLHVDEIVLPGVETPKRGRGAGGKDSQKIHDLLETGAGDHGPGRQGPAQDEGRAALDGARDPRPLHGLLAAGRGRRRLAQTARQGARPPAQGGRQTRPAGRRRDHPHGRLRRQTRGLRARAAVPLQAARGARQARRGDGRPRPRLPGGGPVGARRARHLLRALRARDRRRPAAAPAADLVLHAHRARARRPRRAVGGRGRAAVRALRRRERDRGDALAPRRPAERRLPDHRLRRGADRHRRQHRLVHRPRQRRAAGGHDHENEPRGGRGGRAPAAPARHRRDHRHRLHRHGARAQPRRRARRRCAERSTRTARRRSSSRSRRSAWSR